MEPQNLEILKIALSVNEGESVHLRSIDMRLMRSCPSVIQNGELLQRIRLLVDMGALIWKQKNASVLITEQGKLLVS
jgi:hypothetical protein